MNIKDYEEIGKILKEVEIAVNESGCTIAFYINFALSSFFFS